MSTETKTGLLIAAAFVLVGGLLFVGVMTALKWDFTKLSTVKYETNRYEISETFDDISLNTDTAAIVFAVSDDGNCRVECYEEEKATHSVTVKEGTLTVELKDERSFWDLFGINFGSPCITVYLPQTAYASLLIDGHTGAVEIPAAFSFADAELSLSTGDVAFYASVTNTLRITTSTGNIRVENLSAGALDLSVSTGKVTVAGVTCRGDVHVGVSTGRASLTDVTCGSVTSRGSTGDISLSRVVAEETISIKRSTGDIRFEQADAAELFMETNTGNVTGTLLTDKVFIAQSDTGRINVPKTTTGGRCEITTDTGNITLSVG